MAEAKKSVKKNTKKTTPVKKTEVKKTTKKVEEVKKEVKKVTDDIKEVKEDIRKVESVENTSSRKITIALLVVLGIIIVLSIFVKAKDVEVPVVESNIQEWVTETQEEQYVITVIGLSYCTHCANYSPIISNIAEEYGLPLYWYDVNTMGDEDAQILTTTYNLESYEGASPYTAITYNGEFITDHVGEMDEEATLEFLRDAGVIE